MTTSTLRRHVESDGVFNLRDLGGYPTVDGRAVRWRTAFRADGLHRACPTADLLALKWRTVVDLRTVVERNGGCFVADGIDVVHLPMLREPWEVTPPTAETGDAVEFLVTRYLVMADTGGPAIATAFELLASPRRLPAVFHCTAGKDRTGVLAALLLATLGVDDDNIAADYQLSERAMTAFSAWITSEHPDLATLLAQQPAAMLASPAEAILGFLGALRDRYGSTDGYLATIGVKADTRELLRDTLLEP